MIDIFGKKNTIKNFGFINFRVFPQVKVPETSENIFEKVRDLGIFFTRLKRPGKYQKYKQPWEKNTDMTQFFVNRFWVFRHCEEAEPNCFCSLSAGNRPRICDE